MSLRITLSAICDQCGKEICRADDVKVTHISSVWHDMRSPYGKPKIMMVVERYRRASFTYCLPCADSAGAQAKSIISAVIEKTKP